ncbi:TonB family protein [Chitinibacter sp. SCUT-21]|uniref:energy transducer TonB n=1 Tax=Chitinibacter sp. SCUT-21 TaxID=2970891 RepID=UPI0035A64173
MSKRMLGIALLSAVLHFCVVWWGPGLRTSAKPAATAEPLMLSLNEVQSAPVKAKSKAAAPPAQPVAAKAPPRAHQGPNTPAAVTPVKPVPAQPHGAKQPGPALLSLPPLPNAADTVAQANGAASANPNPKANSRANALEGDAKADDGAEVVQLARYNAAYLNNPIPEVPFIARQRCQSGLLKLRVLVSTSGKPIKVNIEKPSGCDAFDRAALNTVKSDWRFEPGKRGSTAIESEVIVPMPLKILEQ